MFGKGSATGASRLFHTPLSPLRRSLITSFEHPKHWNLHFPSPEGLYQTRKLPLLLKRICLGPLGRRLFLQKLMSRSVGANAGNNENHAKVIECPHSPHFFFRRAYFTLSLPLSRTALNLVLCYVLIVVNEGVCNTVILVQLNSCY